MAPALFTELSRRVICSPVMPMLHAHMSRRYTITPVASAAACAAHASDAIAIITREPSCHDMFRVVLIRHYLPMMSSAEHAAARRHWESRGCR